MLQVSTLLDAQMIVSVFLVRSCLTEERVTGTNQDILNQMRRRSIAIFQLWIAQNVRSLFLVYSGTKDMTDIAVTIQHIYYYIKINYTTTCPTFYLLFNQTSYLGQNRSPGDGINSESIFNMYVINTLYFQ